MTPESVTRDAVRELFLTYRRTAFRLETREAYNEPYTPRALAQFLAGEPVDVSFLDTWTTQRRADLAAGKQMSRVRVVTEPLNDYARYSLHVSRVNVEAGEDIRYLARDRAELLSLPDEDYWLFDSELAAVFSFGDDGKIDDILIVDDPAGIAERCRWRDVAWANAVRREEYAAVHGVT
ncbi:DUF6879 family protein [Jiangella alba]|uniref:DUF6879 domain-containing protein n=1 Tax=Jiangella alba TaxID=561176 RepID=A0A1H5J9E4_9ACTN|nr:DUF6879 family protein [Jiangella alba]SEE48671.1 hypothetical protein SAMN04488561_1481 [Jiangella alba]